MSQIYKGGGSPAPPGNFPITPYVVGLSGQAGYQTIQAAIDAAHAVGGGVVYIQPGSYTENLTLFTNIDLYGTPAVSQNQGESVSIIGTHIPPDSGHVGFNSICFISTTNVFLSSAAGTAHLVFLNCESAVENGYFLNLPNWTGILEIFDNNAATAGGTFPINDGGINNSGGATVLIFSAVLGQGSNIMNLSGAVIGQGASFGCPVNFASGSNASMDYFIFDAQVTMSGNATGIFNSCHFVAGSAAAFTQSSSSSVSLINAIIQSTNNPAITGSGVGTLTIDNISFIDNSQISNTLTLNGISLTPNINTNQSIGNLVIKSTTLSSGNNKGFIQMYLDGDIVYIPYFSNIAP